MTYDKFNFRKSSEPLPVFFFSHGGPKFADKESSNGNIGAWNKTREVGNYIKTELKPDFIIAVSAHWKSDSPNNIEVTIPGPGEKNYIINNVESNKIREDENSLIYDFYNFPQKFYDSQFHTISNKAIANDIVKTINDSKAFNAKTNERGVDHGVFVPFKVAFADDVDLIDSKKLDVDVPLIQVSLANSSDIESHYKLGQILSKYRDYNGLLLFSGMSVHNLKDFRFPSENQSYAYGEQFNNLLTKILTNKDSSKVLEELKNLPLGENKEIYEASHPTNEHFLPLVIAAGASREDEAKLLYGDVFKSLGWNLYRWGITNKEGL